METTDKNRRKLWLPSWRGVIITLLVGSNIILIRIIEALVYKGQLLEESYRNSTQTLADQLRDGEIRMMELKKQLCEDTNRESADQLCNVQIKLKEIKKQLCVNTSEESAGCMLCPGGWLRHNENCYYYSSDGDYRTWNESREECDRMGAHLLVIGDPEQQKFINRSNRGQAYEMFWIGLYRDGDGWRWVDGQIYNTDLFQLTGESPGNCVLMHMRGVYYKDDCLSRHGWICQKRALKI